MKFFLCSFTTISINTTVIFLALHMSMIVCVCVCVFTQAHVELNKV